MSVDPRDGTLWLTNRGGNFDPTANRVYNVTTSGEQITSFATASFDPVALNASGVALDDDPRPWPGIDLGLPERTAALALRHGQLVVASDASVIGDVAIGRRALGVFRSALVDGDLAVDSRGEVVVGHRFTLTGTVRHHSLADTEDRVRAALSAYDRVARSVRSVPPITTSTVLAGEPGLNLVRTSNIQLSHETLTLSGDERSVFVIRVGNNLLLHQGAEIILDGIEPEQVLFIVRRGAARLHRDSTLRGLVATRAGLVTVTNGSTVQGAVVSGGRITVRGGASVVAAD